MAVKKKPEEVKKGAPEYMNTYGDMVTLLLCFFVLLYSMSSLDVSKFQAMAQSFSRTISIIEAGGGNGVSNLLGNGVMEMPSLESSILDAPETKDNTEQNEKQTEATNELKEMSSDFQTYFAENNLQENVQVEVFDQYLRIRFGDGILFDSGKANIKPEAIPILNMVANELLKYPESEFKIEGHTDNIPINTPLFQNNWWLSSARAISVGLFFIDEMGITPTRVSMEGFGEYRPIETNATPEGRSKNRRVEIKIMSKFYSNVTAEQSNQ